MKKLFVVLPLIFTPVALSESMEYESIVNKLNIDTAGNVRFSVLLREEDDEILCDTSGYHFGFTMNNSVMEKWYDTLMLARSSSSLLNFHYEPTNASHCNLLSITLPKLYERGTGPGEEPDKGSLQETGNYGNVALNGTNGLSNSSFSASDFYGQDAPRAAFDGHTFSEKINADAEDKVGRGIWLVQKSYQNGQLIKPWLQVDFGKEVAIIGTRLFINSKSLDLGRSPRNVTIETSSDGVEFVELERFVLTASEVTSTAFSGTAKARYFRIVLESNYGDDAFFEIDEWEFYQEK